MIYLFDKACESMQGFVTNLHGISFHKPVVIQLTPDEPIQNAMWIAELMGHLGVDTFVISPYYFASPNPHVRVVCLSSVERIWRPEQPVKRIIFVMGAKGGVGKTLFATKVAVALSRDGDVLVADLDPQGSVSGLGAKVSRIVNNPEAQMDFEKPSNSLVVPLSSLLIHALRRKNSPNSVFLCLLPTSVDLAKKIVRIGDDESAHSHIPALLSALSPPYLVVDLPGTMDIGQSLQKHVSEIREVAGSDAPIDFFIMLAPFMEAINAAKRLYFDVVGNLRVLRVRATLVVNAYFNHRDANRAMTEISRAGIPCCVVEQITADSFQELDVLSSIALPDVERVLKRGAAAKEV